MPLHDYDAVVVGSGPNGLAAGIVLQRAGLAVKILEARETVGGGMRTAELTEPGFHHDVCSAVHPLGAGSPFFRQLPLDRFGLEWIQPPLPLAHPFDDGRAAVLERSLTATADRLGQDRAAYEALFLSFTANWKMLRPMILSPPRLPSHPGLLTRFGLRGLQSARKLARRQFETAEARALFGGLAAHAILPLNRPATAAIGLVLGILAHTEGWPIPRGGSQKIADALADYFRSLGGEIETGRPVRALRELPRTKAVLLDVTPRQFLQLADNELTGTYRRQLERYRYGAGIFKIDWALNAPVPFRSPECQRAGTIHLGGTLDEIVASEAAPARGVCAKRPFVLFVQPSLLDATRAPAGKQTAWAYCHVPHGSTLDMTDRIEDQVERFAPGFRETILARHTMNTQQIEAYNPNYVGGDINGGAASLDQLFTRPVLRLNPYTTALRDVYLCSSATPPGGGVHGLCGYHAARQALERTFRIQPRGSSASAPFDLSRDASGSA